MNGLVGELFLCTRTGVAHYTGRHENVIRRYVEPIACDAKTRALLFDLDAASAALDTVRRRLRRVA